MNYVFSKLAHLSPRVRALVFLVLALGAITAPGVRSSWFSGAPFSTYSIVAFAFVLMVVAAVAIVAPLRRISFGFIIAAAVLLILKIALYTSSVQPGWRGYYETRHPSVAGEQVLRPEFFYGAVRYPYRLDQQIAFAGVNAGLYFFNDALRFGAFEAGLGRDHEFPLRVRWMGHFVLPEPGTVTFTTSSMGGTVSVYLDGKLVAPPSGDRRQVVSAATQGAHNVVVVYEKPARAWPNVSVVAPEVLITAGQASEKQVEFTRIAALITSLTGVLLLILLVAALLPAYLPVRALLRERLMREPSRVALLLFVTAFLAIGLWKSVPWRHGTMYLSGGNDPIAYEAQARNIMSSGLLMNATGQFGSTAPFYFYPLYSYYLAAFHVVMGEDFSSVIFANFFALAFVGVFAWLIVLRRLPYPSAFVSLGILALFTFTQAVSYALLAYTDNLYLPMVLFVVFLCERAVSLQTRWLFFLVGVAAAFAAATRPSFLVYPPIVALAVLLWKRLGSKRYGHAFAVLVGFAVGLAPFTYRNFVIAKKFVLLVESFVMLPYFLYSPEMPKPNFDVSDPPGFLSSLTQVGHLFAESPLHYLWVEIRKLLFTFGYTSFGPYGAPESPRWYFILPLLFLAAMMMRKVPFSNRFAFVTFAMAHVAAMILAAPWTYGFKTIIPFHAAMLIASAWLLRPVVNPASERSVDHSAAPPPVRNRRVSVILPTYNEKDSIRGVIREFFDTGVVHEVLVINNNAAEGTSEQVAGTGAVEIFEPRQGYGSAIRRGLAEARGDYLIVCEPDATFLARDSVKLLAYAEDFDVVYGSRTAQQMVWRGANMGLFLRWGNYAVAKYMEFLYNATSLTDVGCTMRLIRKDVAERLMPHFEIDGNQFGPEMMILSLRAGYRVVQIPVNYLPRVGESAVTGDPLKAFILGLQMIWLITSRRFRKLPIAQRIDADSLVEAN